MSTNLKILIVGDPNVGKSSILARFVDEDDFNQNRTPTVGADFKIKSIRFRSKNIKLRIFDASGADRFKAVTQSYYK